MNVSTGVEPGAGLDAGTTRDLLRAHRGSAVVIALMALAYLVQAVVWGRAVEPFDAPDEPEHIQMAQFVADHGRWPVMGDIGAHLLDETTHRLVPTPPKDPVTGARAWDLDPSHAYSVRHPYVVSPPLGYCGLTAGVVAGRAIGLTGMGGARVAAAFMGALGVLAAGLTVLRLRPARPDLHLLAPGIVAFLPQFVFTGAYVNPDVLGFSLCGVVLWRLAVGAARGWDAAQGAKLGAAAALAFLAKASAVPVVGALVVAALWTLVRSGVRGGTRDRVAAVAAAALAAGVVVLPWFLFLRTKYGTFLPWADPEFDAIVASLPVLPRLRLFDGSLAASRIADADTWWKLVGGPWMVTSVKSSLGKFGWMDRPLPLWHYAGLLVVWAAGAAGLLRGVLAAARARRWPAGSSILVACGAASILQLAASVNYSLRWDYQAQGRYLFPAILCAAVLAAFGFGRLVPAPHRVVAARIAVLLCAVLSFAAFPYAYGPLPPR